MRRGRRAHWPAATWQPFCPFANGGRHEENVAKGNNCTCRASTGTSILGRRVLSPPLAPSRPSELARRPDTRRESRHGRREPNRRVPETPRRVCGQGLSIPRASRVSASSRVDVTRMNLTAAVRVYIYECDVKRFGGRSNFKEGDLKLSTGGWRGCCSFTKCTAT